MHSAADAFSSGSVAGVKCPKCGKGDKVFALKTRLFHWLCKNRDNYRFSVTTRTIFKNTKKPLKIWFRVAYFMLVARKGRSALEIHRTVFGEDSTSDHHITWYMWTRLRAAMRNPMDALMGEVEIDGTYVGGKDAIGALAAINFRHNNRRIPTFLRSFFRLASRPSMPLKCLCVENYRFQDQ